MEHCAAVCLAFPPEHLEEEGDAIYDKAVNIQLVKLSNLLNDSNAALRTHGVELLNLLDPAVNSLSYLAVLHTLLIPIIVGPRDTLLEKLVEFLLSFDARQLRYAGSHLLDILSLVGTSLVLPPSIAVQVLAEAILRLDPTGSILTSTHIQLVKCAYNTNNVSPAVLRVIDKSIVFYPGMANHGQPEFLCDMSLPPHKYISAKDSRLTALLKPQTVLEYDLLCGLMYCTQRDWAKAMAAFERVVTFPAREQGTSKIMAEAYKKWILVSLLLKGKPPSLPSYTGAGARKLYEVLAKPYASVVSFFETENAASLKAEANKYLGVWQEDGNMGLMQEVLAAYQRWQVLNLQDVYSKISLPEIRQQTKSAQTGDILDKDEEIETLIQSMIVSGMMNGDIEKDADGTTFLTFLPPSTVLSEREFATELAQAALRMKALQPVLKSTNERLGTSKEYVKHIIKEQRRGQDKGEQDMTLPFDRHVDDEDLMGGITSTG